ncbi:MAG: alpha/beta fold hydrolase [Xylophilus ampelinus]
MSKFAAAACIVSSAQAYADPPWHSTVLEVQGPQGPLRGTLLVPADAASGGAVVLIVPGSGPTDRDGNGASGLRAASYRLLAEGLAMQGIATLRIDKRGLFGSASAVSNPNDVTISAYADDVARWVSALRQRSQASCIWVLGHSEGGVVALAAAPHVPGICGLVLLATPGRRIGQVLRA